MRNQPLLLVALLGASMFMGLALADPASAVGSDAPQSAPKVVAVLDFQDLGPSVELASLGKALARMLVTDLSRMQGLKVVQRERMEKFVAETGIGERGLASSETAVLAGRALGADYVVQGTFGATSKQITVEVTMGSRESPQGLLSSTFSGATAEFLRLEQQVVSAIAKQLGVEPAKSPTPASTNGSASPAVAVMDFDNLSASGDLDPLQPALSDLFCATLCQIPRVTLVERAKIQEIIKELGLSASGLVDPSTAAKRCRLLGAQRMLLSSFLEMGGILRLDSHLIDTESGQLVAALSVSGPSGKYEALMEELARQVAAALSVAMPGAADQVVKASAPTKSWEAYTYLQRGLHFNNLGQPREALQNLMRCLYVEPECEQALVCALNLGAQTDPATTLDLAERTLGKYASNPDKGGLVETAYRGMYLAYVYSHRLDKALEVVERALAANPSDRKKVELLMDKAQLLQQLGRATPDALLGIYRQVLDFPAEQVPMRMAAGVEMADILMQKKDMGQAISVVLEVARTPPEPNWGYWSRFLETVQTLLQHSLDTNHPETARKLLDAAVKKCPMETAVTHWADLNGARVAEATGNWDDAIRLYGNVAGLHDTKSFFEVVLKIGDLQLKKGDTSEAARAYQRVIGCANRGSPYYAVNVSVAQAREKLAQLGVAVPTPQGYQPNSLLSQEFGHPTLILADNGYALDSLHVLPLVNPGEALARYQTVVMDWPKAGQPWWVTQSWLNFVRRGGGIFLSMSEYVHPSAAGPIESSLGVTPTPDRRTGTWGWRILDACGDHPAGRGIDKLLVVCVSPFEAARKPVLATWEGCPMLAAVERGLGRVLVAGFPLSPIGKELYLRFPDYSYSPLPGAEDFLLSAFDWLRQQQATADQAALLARFRAVSDGWARKDYSRAIGLLRGVCADYAGTEWEELAGYTIGEIMQGTLHSYEQARRQFEQVYERFPKGGLALAARMAAADCAEAANAFPEEMLQLYAKVAKLGPNTEIGATAQLKIGFIHLLAGRLDGATSALQAVVNDFPGGYAKTNALCALGYCYERTGRTSDAVRTYKALEQTPGSAEVPDPVYPGCFPDTWRLLMAQDERAGGGQPPAQALHAYSAQTQPTLPDCPQVTVVEVQGFARWRLERLIGGGGASG